MPDSVSEPEKKTTVDPAQGTRVRAASHKDPPNSRFVRGNLKRQRWSSPTIPLNIAEGNGKASNSDRRRYFDIARGSVLECAAIQDVLVVGRVLHESESQERKNLLDRMAVMLSRLGGRGYDMDE